MRISDWSSDVCSSDLHEMWKGLATLRPRFLTLPGTGGRRHVAALVRALVPVIDALRESFAFDVIDAEFFFPDGPAAIALGQRYGVPVSTKARGADIHHWGQGRSEERRVGTECVSTCRSRGAADHLKNKNYTLTSTTNHTIQSLLTTVSTQQTPTPSYKA